MISDVQSFVALHPGLTMGELCDAGCSRNEVRRLRSIGRIVDMGELVHGSWISRFYPYGARGRDISCMEALVDKSCSTPTSIRTESPHGLMPSG